jgi:hypothetical protein
MFEGKGGSKVSRAEQLRGMTPSLWPMSGAIEPRRAVAVRRCLPAGAVPAWNPRNRLGKDGMPADSCQASTAMLTRRHPEGSHV